MYSQRTPPSSTVRYTGLSPTVEEMDIEGSLTGDYNEPGKSLCSFSFKNFDYIRNLYDFELDSRQAKTPNSLLEPQQRPRFQRTMTLEEASQNCSGDVDSVVVVSRSLHTYVSEVMKMDPVGKKTFPDKNLKLHSALHERDAIPILADYRWMEFKMGKFLRFIKFFSFVNRHIIEFIPLQLVTIEI